MLRRRATWSKSGVIQLMLVSKVSQWCPGHVGPMHTGKEHRQPRTRTRHSHMNCLTRCCAGFYTQRRQTLFGAREHIAPHSGAAPAGRHGARPGPTGPVCLRSCCACALRRHCAAVGVRVATIRCRAVALARSSSSLVVWWVEFTSRWIVDEVESSQYTYCVHCTVITPAEPRRDNVCARMHISHRARPATSLARPQRRDRAR